MGRTTLTITVSATNDDALSPQSGNSDPVSIEVTTWREMQKSVRWMVTGAVNQARIRAGLPGVPGMVVVSGVAGDRGE